MAHKRRQKSPVKLDVIQSAAAALDVRPENHMEYAVAVASFSPAEAAGWIG